MAAVLRNLSPVPIAGFARDGTFALATSSAILLGDDGLEIVDVDRARGRSEDTVATFEIERVGAKSLWRVFDESRAISVDGAPLNQIPFSILGPADVISRGKQLRLRFEAPFDPVCFGVCDVRAPFSTPANKGTLLNPICGTAPFVFRVALEVGTAVVLRPAIYGADGMQLVDLDDGWRACAIAEASHAQSGTIPDPIITGLAAQAAKASLFNSRIAPPPYSIFTTSITSSGEIVSRQADATAEIPYVEMAQRLGPFGFTGLNIADFLAELGGRSTERDDEGRYTWAQAASSGVWKAIATSTFANPLGWFRHGAVDDAIPPDEIARWVQALLPERSAANEEARAQIEMMRPADLAKLRLTTFAANSRAAI